MFFWGMTFVWTKIALNYWEPFTIILARLILSTLILYGFLWVFKKRESINRSDLGLFFLSALFNPFFYFIGENYGVKFSTASVSSVMIATIPIFTAIMAFFVYKERLSALNIFGMALSMAGIVIMLSGPGFSLSSSLKGLLWLLFAVISAVFYAIVLKKLTFKYSSTTIIAFQNFLGIFLFLPFFLIFDYKHFITVPITQELIFSIVALAIFGSSLAFIFFTIGMREIGVTRTSLFSNLIPFFTAIFSFILLKESFTALKIIGMVIVIAGVALSQIKRSRLIPPSA